MTVKCVARASLFVMPLLAISVLAPIAARAQAQPATEASPSAPAVPTQIPPTMTSPAAPAAGTPATPAAGTAASPPPAAPTEAAAPQPAPAAPGPSAALTLPRDLSPWGMFMAADIVVKAVMVGLAFASVLTWTIWFAKAIELLMVRRRMQATIDALSQARSWGEASARVKGRDDASAALMRAADAELRLSADALSPSGVKERIASRLERIEAAAGRRMIRGTGILATIGATAPFVGLFGTVWGIMNSFIGISKQHTTNLAVVAPGIAEALLATALGLVAAIPAVVMYNMFSRWIAGYRALHADASAEILRIVSRDLDRGAFEHRSPDRRRPIAAE
jgi:biopolymer transport protein ExbB